MKKASGKTQEWERSIAAREARLREDESSPDAMTRGIAAIERQKLDPASKVLAQIRLAFKVHDNP